MKTIKMDYMEFEQLHKVINEQEALIKTLKKKNGNIVQIDVKNVDIPRHCFKDKPDYGRFSIGIPIITVGEKADNAIKILKEKYERLHEQYKELYFQSRRNIEDEIREEIEKKIRKEIREENKAMNKPNKKKKWYQLR